MRPARELPVECRLHPGTAAVTTCEVCRQPICETCRAKSAEIPLCYPCSWELEEPSGAAASLDKGLVDELGLPVPEGPGVKGAAGGAVRYGLAFLLTGGVATLVGLGWWKFTALLGHDSLYYCLAAAFVAGLAARVSYGGRQGRLLPLLGGGMAAYTILLHDVLTVQDLIAEDARAARVLKQMPLADRVVPLFVQTLESLTPLGWILLAVGVLIGGAVPIIARPIGSPASGTKPAIPAQEQVVDSAEPGSA